MTERRGTKALETWCRRVTQGYPGVKVENMTTSWRDGLAFCALIHHFRPDLIDFARLDKEDVYGNNELAFRIAERHLGIPALLDAEDMAEYPVPDRLSILTYLSQFYQAFASNSASPIKKSTTDSPDGSLVLVQGNVQQSPKMEVGGAGVGVGREPCVVCREPVFLAERLRVESRLYHRVCFKCARCTSQLNPSDCYEAESGGYVCETCPDEMWEPPDPPPLPRAPPPSGDSGQLPGDSGHQTEDSADLPSSPGSRQSLVAMRRLFFDTDDAKLLKHDPHHQIVHSISSLVSNKIKDLSSSVNNNDSSFTKANNLEKINDTDYVNNEDFVKSTTVKTSFYDSSKNSNFIVDNGRTKKEEEEDEANIVNKSSFNVNPDDIILEKNLTLPPNDSDAFLNEKEDSSNLNNAPSIVIEAVNIEVKETDGSVLLRKEANNELDEAPRIVTEATNVKIKETDDSVLLRKEANNELDDASRIVTEAINVKIKETDNSVLLRKEANNELDDASRIVTEAINAKIKETDGSVLLRKEGNNELDDASRIVTEATNAKIKETDASIVHEEENCNNSKDVPSTVIEAANSEIKDVSISKKEKGNSKLSDSPSIVVNADVARTVEEKEDEQKTPVPIPRSPNKKKKIQLDAHVQKSSSLVAPSANLVEAVNLEAVHPEPAPRQTAQVAVKTFVDDKQPVVRTKSVEYPDDLNPFDSDDDESAPQSLEDSGVHHEQPVAVSTNPFGSDSEEDDEETVRLEVKKMEGGSGGAEPRRSYPVLRLGMCHTLKPTSSTNPFDSDDDEEDKADEAAYPIPSPRKSVQSSPEPTPFPRRSVLRSSDRSITSLSSVGSSTSTPRKKRPAPLPPTGIATSSPSSHHSTPSRFHVLSPPSLRSSCSSLSSVRSRKTRRAPLPPTKPPSHPKIEIEAKDDLKIADDTSPTTNIVEPLSKTVVSAQDPDEVPLENSVALEISKIDDDIKKLIIEDTEIVFESEKEEVVKIPGENTCEEVTSEQLETQEENSEIKENLPESTILLEKTEIDVTTNKTANADDSHEPNEIFEEKRITEWIDNSEQVKASSIIEKLEHLKTEKETQYETEKNTICIIDARMNIVNRKDFENVGDELRNKADVDLIGMKLGGRKSSVGKSVETEVLIHQSTPVKKWSSSWSCGDRGLDPLLGEDCPLSQESSFLSSPSASCADTSTYQDLEATSPSPFEKRYKDSQNMHRKISDSGSLNPHKSTYGQWKRKKAPAPPAPNPQRRPVKPMPIHSIKQELNDIEIKQQGLERQGVSLEQKIREKFDTETSISPYIEELVLQLFELVNEKNELFRKQAELMYLRRQHNLEEEHAELEYQIRCLMSRPEANKTDSDKEMEEKLIQRLVEVVERRDAIVQCLEMDRLREAEEDKSINKQLNRFTQALTSEDNLENSQATLSISKKHKKKKKDKHLSVTSSSSALNSSKTNLDLDKDFDESEKLSPESKGNGKKKKKWYTLHHKMTKHL